MKLLRAHLGLGAIVAALALPSLVGAQQCNLQNPPCPGACNPGGGCAAPIAIQHATNSPCVGGGGAISMRGTEFETSCGDPFGTGACADPCATRVAVPPIRFWQYNTYGTANSGCQDPLANGWMFNGLGDFAIGTECGHWALFQANWLGPQLQGCIASANGPLRTVMEISFPNTPTEGSVNHTSWYLIGSVDSDADGYNFDRITGGAAPSCNAAEMAPLAVSGVTIVGLTGACTNNANGLGASPDGNGNVVVQVNITDTNPTWYTEAGLRGAPALIAGYQVVYAEATEPTSSNYFTANWRPALDPTNAANAAGVFALPVSNPVSVGVPNVANARYWLAVRLVYQDTSLNPTTPFPVANAGPLVTSDVGPHCGPVVVGTVAAVEFGSINAVRNSNGVTVSWMTLSEDDTSFFRVFRSTDPQGTEAVVEVAPYVEARGAYTDYQANDATAVANQTYYYYVQEMTSTGPGTRSPAVRAEAQGASAAAVSTGSSSGARRRGN